MCVYWLNYSRKLGREEGGENSEPPSASPIGCGAENTNHRFFLELILSLFNNGDLELILSLFNNGDCPQSSNGFHIREKAETLLPA